MATYNYVGKNWSFRSPKGEEHMNFSQGKLADGLIEEMLELIHKYDETLYTATAIGCLELVKQQLIIDVMESENE